MTKLPPSSLRPPAELFGTPATKPTPKQPSKPALAKATPAKTTPGKVSSDIVTPGKVSPDTRSAIPLPQGKTQTHLPLISPTNQAIAAAKPKGQQLAPGVWFDSSGKTADGGVIRTISIDPRQAELVPIFNSSGPISARQLEKQPGLLAAINASFFGQGGIIGDIKADKKILSDDDRPYLDKITDQRHFLASTADGKVKTGRGGLSENQGFRHFIGGFPALYERSQLSALDQDIRSGVLAKRASYGGASPDSSISRSFAGLTADGRILLVAAGDGKQRSKGVTLAEGARLMRKLGAVEAYVLDGGGSTSMYARGVVHAQTDGRQVWSYLGVKKR